MVKIGETVFTFDETRHIYMNDRQISTKHFLTVAILLAGMEIVSYNIRASIENKCVNVVSKLFS